MINGFLTFPFQKCILPYTYISYRVFQKEGYYNFESEDMSGYVIEFKNTKILIRVIYDSFHTKAIASWVCDVIFPHIQIQDIGYNSRHITTPRVCMECIYLLSKSFIPIEPSTWFNVESSRILKDLQYKP